MLSLTHVRLHRITSAAFGHVSSRGIIAVKEGNEESEAIKALVDTLKSDEIKDFINEKYDGAVIPFEDSADADADKEETADVTTDTETETTEEAAE